MKVRVVGLFSDVSRGHEAPSPTTLQLPKPPALAIARPEPEPPHRSFGIMVLMQVKARELWQVN